MTKATWLFIMALHGTLQSQACRSSLQLAAGVALRPRESRNCTQQATDDIINDVHDIVIAGSHNTLTLPPFVPSLLAGWTES